MTGYLRQIQRAVTFIEAHLGEELRASVIARHAGISMWHFQRVFSAMLGQPLMDYVRSRRLSRAMEALCCSRQSILDIALDHGFGSQEAFTRAFKDMFGITPGICRTRKGAGLAPQAVPPLTVDHLFHLHHRITMTPRIETITPKLVVGIERPFISVLSPQRNNHLIIPQLWQDFSSRMASIPNRQGQDCLGSIECDNGESGQCRYLACVEVSSVAALPEGMISREIGGGCYAIFTHRGEISRIGQTLEYVYGSWLPRSGHRLRDAAEIEVYGAKFDASSPDSEMEYCLPIQ